MKRQRDGVLHKGKEDPRSEVVGKLSTGMRRKCVQRT